MRKDKTRIRFGKSIALMLSIMIALSSFCTAPIAQTKISLDTTLENGLLYEDAAQKVIRTYPLGDATADGILNTGDAVLILRYSVSLVTLTEMQKTLADANEDTLINTGDAVKVLRVTVGLDTTGTIELESHNNYTVTYDDGIDAVEIAVPEQQIVEEGTTFKVSDMIPVSDGGIFRIWRCSFNGLELAPNANMLMPSCNITLTAEWSSTVSPTPTATGEPTAPPTSEPTTPPSAHTVKVLFRDTLNELDVEGEVILSLSGIVTLNATNVTIPEGYMVETDLTISVVADVTCTLFLYPYMDWNYQGNPKTFRVIKNLSGLNNVRNNMEVNYLLDCDIDMSEYTEYNGNFWCLGWPGFLETGTKTPFTGIFDGNGHTISNFTSSWLEGDNSKYINVGLFSKNKGTIMNLNVISSEQGEGENAREYYGVYGCKNVGVITGDNYGTIIGCHVNALYGASDYMIAEGGSVSGGATGGIAGCNQGVIQQCSVIGFGTGHLCAGGIVGKNLSYAIIKECFFVGGINSELTDEELTEKETRYIGGIAGATNNSTVTDSYAIFANTVAAEIAVGGFYGATFGGDVVSNSYIVNYYNLYSHTGYYIGQVVGYAIANPSIANLYQIGGQNPYTTLPDGFSSSVWTLDETASLEGYPDLIKNRRPEFDVTYD